MFRVQRNIYFIQEPHSLFKTTRNWFSIVGVSGPLENSADPAQMKIHARYPGEPQLYGNIDLSRFPLLSCTISRIEILYETLSRIAG